MPSFLLPDYIWLPSPGISVAFLALLAGVWPLIDDWAKKRERKWPCILYAVALALLCYVEVTSVVRDRRGFEATLKNQERMAQEMNSKLDQENAELVVVNGSILEMHKELSRVRTTTAPQTLPEKTLKFRALDLANDIAGFLYQRTQTRPELVMPPPQTPPFMTSPAAMDNAWAVLEREEKKHNIETSNMYQHFYASRVKNIVQELRDKKVFDSNACDAPKDSWDMIACAAQIQTAAKKLP